MHAGGVRHMYKVHIFDGDKYLVKLQTGCGIDIEHIFAAITVTVMIGNKKMLQM